MTTRPITATAASSLLLLALAGPSPGDEEPYATTRFGEVLEVNVVNVDVVVVDRKGEIVRDLEPEDFRLFEDGEPVAITHFSFVEAATPSVETAPTGVGQPSEPATPTTTKAAIGAANDPAGGAPSVPDPGGEPFWMVVWIDNVHSRMHDRNRALRAIRTMIREETDVNDRLMVASYYRTLQVDQPFTRDREAISSALTRLETAPSDGVRGDRERMRYIRLVDTAPTAKDAVELVRPYAGNVRTELWGTLAALEQTVRQIAGLPDRKAILYVSSGLPLKPGAAQWNAIEYKWPRQLGIHELMLYDQTTEFQELAEFAGENDVVLHTLDGSGIRGPAVSDAEQEMLSLPTMSANLDADVRQNHQLPLRQLADSTGGRAILNRNDAGDALERLAREMHTYYSLGYSPSRPEDDRYHRLRVEVRRKGVRIHHREVYRDKTPSQRMVDRLRATLAHGLDDNPLGVAVSVQGASADGRRQTEIPIRVILPIRNLALHPDGTGYRARFRLYLAAMDDRGDMSDVLEIPAVLDIPPDEIETARNGLWRMSRSLKLRRGHQRLAVGVRDEIGLISGFSTVELEP